MQLVACGTEKGSQKPRKATLFLPCVGYKLHVFSFARKLFVTTIKFPPKRSANAVKCCSKKRLHRGMNGRILYTTLWELLGEKHRYVLTFAGFVPHPHPPPPHLLQRSEASTLQGTNEPGYLTRENGILYPIVLLYLPFLSSINV